MRLLFVILASVFLTISVGAARNTLKPTDFEPLTNLPWGEPGATPDQILDAIFRETNLQIRLCFLGEYLRTVPLENFEQAFETSIRLEGKQTPDELVEFCLYLWAARDPAGCWQKTEQLFALVGLEEGWLGYDSWKSRPRITVRNREAIFASRYWITSDALRGFPIGAAQSSMPKKELTTVLKRFANKWFEEIGTWPGYARPSESAPGFRGYVDSSSMRQIRDVLGSDAERLRGMKPAHVSYNELAFEMALRRRVELLPQTVVEVIEFARQTKWRRSGSEERPAGPSTELLILAARHDLPAMIAWADKAEGNDAELLEDVRRFLMSRVDAERRTRWIKEARGPDSDETAAASLMESWAAWDPLPALDAAIKAGELETFQHVLSSAASGPWGGHPQNTCHFNLGVINDLKLSAIPPKLLESVVRDGWYMILEDWGDIDCGETARHGLNFILETKYVPRTQLIRFFSGDDLFADDGDMLDRTFCTMRAWAVTKPDEMRKWIGTIKDQELAKALTWLLENPWGTGSEAPTVQRTR